MRSGPSLPMTSDITACELSDKALFWPTFLVFAAMLIGLNAVTAPPGANVVQVLVSLAG